MNLSTFGFILGGVLLNAAAQLALKAGVRPLGALSLDGLTLLPTLWRVFTQGPVVLGLGLYLASVVLWLVTLSRVDVSLAYPMLSLGYVVNALAAWWLFGEALGPAGVAGMVLILAGVWLLARHGG
jgi:multidrug transporter EmrE-like cation transporter